MGHTPDDIDKVSQKKNHHAFENEIFNAYRKKQKKLKKAIKLVKKNGYEVFEKKQL